MSFGVRYLLQSNLSACSRTIFALSVGSLMVKADGPAVSGARALSKYAYASPSCKNQVFKDKIDPHNLEPCCIGLHLSNVCYVRKMFYTMIQ